MSSSCNGSPIFGFTPEVMDCPPGLNAGGYWSPRFAGQSQVFVVTSNVLLYMFRKHELLECINICNWGVGDDCFLRSLLFLLFQSLLPKLMMRLSRVGLFASPSLSSRHPGCGGIGKV